MISIQYIVVSVLVYFIAVAIYRLFFHPLAQFPGPKLAALTRLYKTYHDIVHNGGYASKIAKLHEKYGRLVRISPSELHVDDPSFFEKLYSGDGHKDEYAKLHRARIASLKRAFSKEMVVIQQYIIRQNVMELFERISTFSQSGELVDLGTSISEFTRCTMIGCVYAGIMDGREKRPFIAALDTLQPSTLRTWYGIKRSFLPYIKGLRTVIHRTPDSDLPSSEKPFDRCFNDVATITDAGNETTANILRLLICHVFSNPKILESLRDELASAAKDGPILDLQVLEKLPYLSSVFLEGMRLSPGLATRITRIVLDRDVVYGDYCVPRGTPVVMTVVMKQGLDEGISLEQKRFDPDRWMDLNARETKERASVQSSRGARTCPGTHLAWAEMCFLLVSLVWSFDFVFEGTSSEAFGGVSDQFRGRFRKGRVLKARLLGNIFPWAWLWAAFSGARLWQE
ncbi:cytochrome P450 [Nemania sp. FL0916]|nr:cytochrome P450 [Nemania sp. FL0916]